MSSQIFFKYGGSGLSSIKTTFVGGGIVSASAGYRSVSTADAVDGSFDADATGDGIIAAASGDGRVASAAGYGSAVGCTGVSGGLGMGADGALLLYPLIFYYYT